MPATHISLDLESDLVKRFIRSLPITTEGVEIELDGRVICKVVPPFGDSEQGTLIDRGRELVHRARQRNRGISARTIEHEVGEAVDEVRQRKSS